MKKIIFSCIIFALFGGFINIEQVNLIDRIKLKSTGVDIFVYKNGNLVEGALVKVSGNGFCEEKYTP